MKRRCLVTSIVLSLCMTSASNAQSRLKTGSAQFLISAEPASPSSPCEDPLFVSLQGRPVDSLTTLQQEYLMLKTKECAEYRSHALARGGAADRPGRTEQVGISSFPSPSAPREGSRLAAVALVVGVAAIILTISLAAALSSSFGG